jgi:hypothetical protein
MHLGSGLFHLPQYPRVKYLVDVTTYDHWEASAHSDDSMQIIRQAQDLLIKASSSHVRGIETYPRRLALRVPAKRFLSVDPLGPLLKVVRIESLNKDTSAYLL